MLLLDADNAEEYLRATNRVAATERVTVQVLSGGVSNQVLYVARQDAGDDFVLKQARPQLRTPDPWFCTVERIWREVEVLRICQQVLDRSPAEDFAQLPACTPRILFEDRDNYLFAMTAAPREHVVWRGELLAGRAEPRIAAACGRLLARLHAGTWNDREIGSRIGDRSLFEQLRIEPYYESTARANPDAAEDFSRLIASVREHSLCMVHADFSPKNLLVFGDRMMMVDFETGHYGDPAFDLGFFLSHLVLKVFFHASQHDSYIRLIEQFGDAYEKEFLSPQSMDGAVPSAARAPARRKALAQLIARGNQNLAGCMWARLDGTSKVDYLTDSQRRDHVRQFCRWIFRESPQSVQAVVQQLQAGLSAR